MTEAADETRYLSFQVMTALPNFAGIPPLPGRRSLDRSQIDGFVQEVVGAVGETGDAERKLAFAVGPLCLDIPDEETRDFIRDAFAVARERDVAVAFHIDDSYLWDGRTDLAANPVNIETAGWNAPPSTGRRVDWGPEPSKFPPQLCFNSPEVVAAVSTRGALIGAAIAEELARLRSEGRAHLFAAVMTGWETHIGRDVATDSPLGFRALANRGFSESNPPRDADAERVEVVREFLELWADALHEGGIPRDRIFCHIAFTDQGLRQPDPANSYAVKVGFAVPDVAFSPKYRPGISTYPEGNTFTELYAVLAGHGSPGWISAEGTNVSPTSMPGEPTMESYLGRMFNHGAVMTNIFAWGVGGDAYRDNFFRRATEGPEALDGYRRFLRGEQLVETEGAFSLGSFQTKMRTLQTAMSQFNGDPTRAPQLMQLGQRLESLMKSQSWQDADHVADEILTMLEPAGAK